ncbi:MAG: hypothetical protein ABIT71_16540, partial [Vicinamibacteraceae bacterium]
MPHPLLMLAGLAAASTLGVAAPAAAQTSTSAASTMPCAVVLTADEVKAAVGAAMQGYPPDDRGRGNTECEWILRGAPGGVKTLSVSFHDLDGIKASPVAPTADAFFEMLVKA